MTDPVSTERLEEIARGVWSGGSYSTLEEQQNMATELLASRQAPEGVRGGASNISYEHTPVEIAEVYGQDIIERLDVPSAWRGYVRLTIEQAIDHDRSKSRILSAIEPVTQTYEPKLIEYDGEGHPYVEFVSEDVPTVTRSGFAGEVLLSMDRTRVVGIRVYREPVTHTVSEGPHRKFALGDRVTKLKGSSWTGRVVGFYSTDLTPIGYAVESENELGSVQIYPEAALKGASHDQP